MHNDKLIFLGLLAIAISIPASIWFASRIIWTVRTSSGFLVPKEMMPKSQSGETTKQEPKEKRPSRRARDLISGG